jgi:hypothetical protein
VIDAAVRSRLLEIEFRPSSVQDSFLWKAVSGIFGRNTAISWSNQLPIAVPSGFFLAAC